MRIAHGWARLIVFLRWPVLLAWPAAAVAAVMWLPGLGGADLGRFGGIVPEDARAIDAQLLALDEFGLPLLSRTVVVQRDPGGLSAGEQTAVVARAAALTTGEEPGVEVAGALPVINTLGWFPSSQEAGTTALTYLFFRPEVSVPNRLDAAADVLDAIPAGAGPVGVTGALAAREAQAARIRAALPWVEGATLLLVVVIVGLMFRSWLAPALTVAAIAAGWSVATHVVGWGGQQFGMVLPGELEPLLVVLLVGVLTDYAIFYFAGYRRALRDGADPKEAVVRVGTEVTPIVVTAAVTVAVSAALLTVARLSLFRTMGPGLAVAIAVAALLAITAFPAALAVAGTRIFPPEQVRTSRRRAAEDVDGGAEEQRGRRVRRRLAAIGVRRPVAAVVAAASIAGLAWVARPVQESDIAVNLINGLPADAGPVKAAEAAAAGFAPGIVAPTEVVVAGEGVADNRAALRALEDRVAGMPGVAGVLGPDDQPLPAELGLVFAPSGDAARLLVVFAHSPYSAAAINTVGALRHQLPGWLDAVGLTDARALVAGDTALAEEITDQAMADLVRVGIAIFVAELLILIVFLRSVVTPIVLLATSALVLFVALRLAWSLSGLLGVDGLTFYVPFAVAVLLVSLGADYNVFVVGRIWAACDREGVGLREAIVEEGSRAAAAVGPAGLALGLSFALIAIVPLAAFRQFALAMAAGILLDAFFVRSLLVPSLLSLLGRVARWPGGGSPPGHGS